MLDVLNYVLVWGFIWGSIYLGLALGFSLIIGVLRVYHMGYGIFLVASVYLTWTFWRVLGVDLWLAVLLAIVGSSAISAALYPIIRKFSEAEDFLLISLVMIYLICEEVINLVYPIETGVYLPVLIFPGSTTMGYVNVSQQYLFLALASLSIFAIYTLFLKFTRHGLIIRATSQDLATSQLFGVRPARTFLQSLLIAVVPPSLLIIFYSPLTRVDPWMGFPLFIWALQVAILGGLGNLKGTLLAAYVIGFIHSFVGYIINPRAMNLASLIAILIILVLRPRGLARSESVW